MGKKINKNKKNRDLNQRMLLAQQQKGINWSLNKYSLEIRIFLSVTAVKPWNSSPPGPENKTLLK